MMKGPSRQINWTPKFSTGQKVVVRMNNYKEIGVVLETLFTPKGLRYIVELSDGKVYSFPKSRLRVDRGWNR